MSVDSFDFYNCVEEQLFVHVPSGIDNPGSEAGFELCCYGARTFMNFDVVAIVDVAQGVVAWDGVAAVREEVAGNVAFVYENGFLFVEIFSDNDESGLVGFEIFVVPVDCYLFITIAFQEGNISSAACAACVFFRTFPLKYVNVGFAEDYSFLSNGYEEICMFRHFVELAQLIECGGRHFEIVVD